MIGVDIVYSSGSGRTRAVAEHLRVGAEAFPDTGTDLIEIAMRHRLCRPLLAMAGGCWVLVGQRIFIMEGASSRAP